MAGFLRKMKRYESAHRSARRFFAGLTAASVMLTPLGAPLARANEIEKADSSHAGTITTAGNVTNILADEQYGANAFNTFKKFSLDENHIANLHFRTPGIPGVPTPAAANLFNFVGSRIDINGTVNAVKDGQVGGNLYFISVDGMTVGAKGVVNAGSISVITPTETGYDALKKDIGMGFKPENVSRKGVYINPAGTIYVEGAMNTTDGIALTAGTVELGGAAVLQSAQSLDFSTLVNTDAKGSIIADPGITGGTLVATSTASGDIKLEAVALSQAAAPGEAAIFKDFAAREVAAAVKTGKDTKVTARGQALFTATASNNHDAWAKEMHHSVMEFIGTIDNPLGQVVYTSATVELNGKVDADTIKASATADNVYISNNDSTKLSNYAGDIQKLGHFGKSYGAIKKLQDTLNVDVMYSYMGSEATVTVGEGAELKAKGKVSTNPDAAEALKEDQQNPAVSLTANSTVKNVLTAATSSADPNPIVPKKQPVKEGEKEPEGKRTEEQAAKLPKTQRFLGAAAVYNGTDNKAAIEVKGKIEAKGLVNMQAQAVDAVIAKAVDNGMKGSKTGTAPALNAAVSVATGHNEATVTLAQGSTVKSTESSVLATAIAVNSVDVGAMVLANDEALGSTAISVLDYDSKANVAFNGRAEGKKAVAGTALNQHLRNNITADNSAVDDTPTQAPSQAESKDLVKADGLKGYLQALKGQLSKGVGKIAEGTKKASDLFSVGTSLAVGVEKNTAAVHVGSTGVLRANAGAVKLSAKTLLKDTHVAAMGKIVNANPQTGTKALVGAAAAVAILENEAAVKAADHADIQGGVVDMKAESYQVYDRLGGIVDDLKKLYSDYKAAYEDAKTLFGLSDEEAADYQTKMAQLGNLLNDLRNAVKKSTGLNVDDYVGNLANETISVTNILRQALSTAAGIEKILSSKSMKGKTELATLVRSLAGQALLFAKPENYANFAASSSVQSEGDSQSELAVAGAANINLLTNRAAVEVGEGAKVTALWGKVSLSSDVKQSNVIMNGVPNINIDLAGIADLVKGLVKDPKNPSLLAKNMDQFIKVRANTEAPAALGGTLGVALHDTESTVTVGKGAQITGAAIDLHTDRHEVATDLSYSAGKSGSAGFSGLFSWLGGKGTNRITVAPGAFLTAKTLGGPNAGKFGAIDLLNRSNSVMTNLVGAVAWGSGGASVGASGAVTDYAVTNRIAAGGTYVGRSLDVNALTDGVINTLAIAGSLSAEKAPSSKAQAPADAIQEDAKVKAIEDKADKKADEAQAEANKGTKDAAEKTENNKQGGNNSAAIKQHEAKNKPAPKVHIAGSGSFALNVLNVDTEASLEKAKVTLQKNVGDTAAGDVHVKAEDASFVGAWSGAAAATWKQSKATQAVKDTAGNVTNKDGDGNDILQNQVAAQGTPNVPAPNAPAPAPTNPQAPEANPASKVHVALAGAAALNVSRQNVTAKIADVTIENANAVHNVAQKDGAAVAAGLALSLTKAGAEASSFSGAGAFSFNEAKNDVTALMDRVTLKNQSGGVSNLAYNSDTQVAGGVNAELLLGGKLSVGGGGTVAVNDLHNAVTAKIAGSSFDAQGDVKNLAVTDYNQITTAIGVSAEVGAKTGVAFNGALALANTKNDSQAIIEGSTIGAKSVDNRAYDAKHLAKHFDDELVEDGLDPKGKAGLANAQKNAATKDAANTENKSYQGVDPIDPAPGSTTIVTTALTAAVSTAGQGVGLAGSAAVSVLDNDKTAQIKKSTITALDPASAVTSSAESHAVMVNTAAGAAVGGGNFSGAGSVSVQSTANDTRASMEDAQVSAHDVTVKAETSDVDVNVAGQVSFGQNAAGLAVAFNHIKNNTEAALRGSEVRSNGGRTAVEAKTSGTVVAVSAGVSAASTAAVNGSVAINQGKTNARAIVDESEGVIDPATAKKKRSKLENVNQVSVKAEDDSTKAAVAGGLQGAGAAAVGGAVAWNEIGGVGRQQTSAALNHADITSFGNQSAITVKAEDKSTLGTAALGIGGAGTAAVEGAAVTSDVAKDVSATMEETNVQSVAAQPKAALEVSSASTGALYSNAFVGAGAGTAGVGGGLAITTALGNTTSLLSGGTQDVGGVGIRARSANKILTIGIGGAGGGAAGVAGSAAVNVQTGDTSAKIAGGAQLTSAHNVVVAATADRAVDTYAGVGTFAFTGGAVGISTTVNTIKTTTNAAIEGKDTAVTARGAAYDDATETRVSAEVQDKVADNEILHDYVNDTSSLQPATYIPRQASAYEGVAVSASSTNKINVIAGNVGAAAMGVGVGGNVTVSTIGGATNARIDKAQVTSDKDVKVIARDYANNMGALGTGSIGGVSGAVGIASNTTTINRDTVAEVTGRNRTANDIKARDFTVEAVAHHGIASIDVAGSIAAVGVANANDVALLSGRTRAGISNVNASLSRNFNLEANRKANLHLITGTAGIGAVGAGVSVNVVQDHSETEAAAKTSRIAFTANDVSHASVKAVNRSDSEWRTLAVGGGIVGGAAGVGVANFKHRVAASLQDTTIGAADQRAKTVSVEAKNVVKAAADDKEIPVSIGGVSVGVRVATLDSRTTATVTGGGLYAAQDLSIRAQEDRNVNFSVANYGINGGEVTVNTAVITSGREVEDAYEREGAKQQDGSTPTKTKADMKKAYEDASAILRQNAMKSTDAFGKGVDGPAVTPSRGSKDGLSGAEVKVTGAELSAGGELSVKSQETNNLKAVQRKNGGSILSVNGSVLVVNAARNSAVTIENSQLLGDAVKVHSLIDGTAKLETHQGSASGASVNGAVAILDVDGENRVRFAGQNTVRAAGKNPPAESKIVVEAKNEAKSEVKASSRTVGAGAATIMVAEAKSHGTTAVDIGDGNTFDAGSRAISLSAKNQESLKAETAIGNLALASGDVAYASADFGSKDRALLTRLTIGRGNTFIGTALAAEAEANLSNTLHLSGMSIGATSLGINHAASEVYSDVAVRAGENTYRGRKDEQTNEQREMYSLSLSGKNTVRHEVDAKTEKFNLTGIANNKVSAAEVFHTDVSAHGMAADSYLRDANISAAGSQTFIGKSGSFGGSVLLGVAAAELTHRAENITNTALTGRWNLLRDIKASAVNREKFDLLSDTSSAAIVNGSGAGIDSRDTQRATVRVENAAIRTAGGQTFEAANHLDDDKTEISTAGFGGLGVNSSRLAQDRTYTAEVSLTNADLSAKGKIGALALTTGRLTAENGLAGLGAVSTTTAFSDIKTAYENRVMVKGGKISTDLAEDGGSGSAITLAAHENMSISLSAVADNQYGLGGAAVTHLNTTLNRKNTVDIADGARIDGSGAVNLYAGRGLEGEKSALTYHVLSDVYNRALIPFATTPRLDSRVSQENTVTTAAGTEVRGIGDVRLAADSAQETMKQSARIYTIYTGQDDAEISTTEEGKRTAQIERKNGATVNGSVTAGRHNRTTVEITGEVKKKDDGTADYSGIKVTVSEGSGVTSKDFTAQTVTLENTCWAQYQDITKHLQEYPKDTEEYKGYKKALDKLLRVMAAQGFAEEEDVLDANKQPTGQKQFVVYHYRQVAALKTPSLTAAGGDVTVEADSLTVNGTLTAQGKPEISITNRTPLYMMVGNTVVSRDGGRVYYNSRNISAEAGSTATIDGIVGLDHIRADAGTGSASTITIKSTGDKQGGLSPTIDIRGKVRNADGDVLIQNDHGSIFVGGTGSVSGRTVTIKAPNGAVVQNNPTGTINIGQDPITHYMIDKTTADKIQKLLDRHYKGFSGRTRTPFVDYADYKRWIRQISNGEIILPDEPASSPEVGIHAGQAVYINGHEVNLNGLVQSGYNSYRAELGSDAQTKVDALDAAWQNAPTALSDSAVRGNDAYLVQAGGDYYDTATQSYKYRVAVYYNPATKQLLTESVKADGGQVYISGNVGNTGSGRILAADGAADISIDTKAVNRGVLLSSIENQNRTGFVRITDNLQGKVFTYTNGQSTVYDIGKPETAATSSGTSFTFTPKQNLLYQWTGGVSSGTVTTKTYKEDSWFGIRFKSPEEIEAQVSDDKIQSQSSTQDGASLGTGHYFVEGNQLRPYAIEGEWKLHDHVKSDMTTTKEEHGIWGLIHSDYVYKWTEYDNSSSTTTYSLKASNPVTIGFLTAESGNIKVEAKGDVTVGGSLRATENKQVRLRSDTGSVRGGGTIHTDDLTVRAKKDIDLQHAALDSAHTAKVQLITDTGSIDLHSTKGHVAVKAWAGTVGMPGEHASIHAYGNLTNYDGGVSLSGRRVELVSQTGTIGAAGDSLRIAAGQTQISGDPTTASVTASARGDIRLEQTTGNMRVNQITSTEGDVFLKAQGDIVSARAEEAAASTANRQGIWTKSKLISASDAANDNAHARAEALRMRKDAVTNRLEQLADGDSGKVTVYQNAAAAYSADAEMAAARTAYISAMKSTTTDADRAAAKAAYQAAQTAYFAGKGYSADEQTAIVHYAEVTRAGNNYGWTKNQLLYAIEDRIINSKPGEVTLSETANVSGRNITLNGTNIGAESTVTIPKAALKNEENLKILAQAQAGDITKNMDADGHLESLTVRRQTPVSVKTAVDGGVNVESHGHVYLSSTKDDALRVKGGINAGTNDVKLMAGRGITAEGTITAKNLTLYGGAGDIGQNGQALKTALTGVLRANTEGSLYLNQTSAHDLTLGAIAVGRDIHLEASGHLRMETPQAGAAVSYLNAGNEIFLQAGGDVGAADNGVRVLTNGAAVHAAAQNAVYLRGEKNGDLILGRIRTENPSGTVIADAGEGTIKLSRQANGAQGETRGNVETGTVHLTGKNADLTGGTLRAEDVHVTATENILQEKDENSVIAAQNATFTVGKAGKAGGKVSIASEANTFKNATVLAVDEAAGVNGGVTLVSKAGGGLTASFGAGAGGTGTLRVTGAPDDPLAVHVKNVAPGQDLTLRGKLTTVNTGIAFTSSGALRIAHGAAYEAGKNMALAARGGITVENGASLKAGGTFAAAAEGDVTVEANATLNAGQDLRTKTTGSVNVENGASLTAGNDLTTAAKGSVAINNGAALKAGGSLATAAGQDVTVNGATLEAGKDLITETNGNVAIEGNATLTAKGNLSTVGQDVTMNGSTLKADKDLITNATGKVDVTGNANLTAGGTLGTTAGQDVTVNGSTLKADKDLTTAAKGKVDVTGNANLTAQGNLSTVAGQDVRVRNGAMLNADKELMTQAQGNVTIENGAHLTAAENLSLAAGGSLLTEAGAVLEAGKTMTLKAGDDVTANNGALLRAGEHLNLAAGGSVRAPGEIHVAGSVTATAERGVVNVATVKTDSGDITLQSKQGDVIAANVEAGRNFTATAGGSVRATGDIKAKGTAAAQAEGEVNVATVTTESGDIALQSKQSDVTAANVQSGRNFNATAGGSVRSAGEIKAKGDATATAEQGTVNVQTVKTDSGDIALQSKQSDVTAANVQSGRNFNATAGGSVRSAGEIKAKGDATATAEQGTVNVQTVKTESGDIALQSKQSDVIAANVQSGQNFNATAGGSVRSAGDIKAKGAATVAAEGEVNVQTVKTESGDIALQSKQ
ncbi:MAG: leukotoxin LktA family filamentous adhesin, partial [Schwartzia sp. (in: firmicutes)]